MKRGAFAPLIIIALSLSIHFRAIWDEFYWDDRPLILEAHHVHSLRSIPVLFAHEMWFTVDLGAQAPTTHVDTYRPLANVSFLVDNLLWHGDARGFHFTILLIHILNLFFFFLILKRFCGDYISLTALVLFAFHPLVSECVHYNSARADSLSVLLLLISVWLLVRHLVLSTFDVIGATLAFLLAALAKETALLFPLLFAGVTWFSFQKTEFRRWVKFNGIVVVGVVLYFALRLNALGRMKAVTDTAQMAEIFVNFPSYVLTFLKSYFLPLRNMPMQHFVVDRPPASLWKWLWASLSYLGLILSLWYFFRKSFFKGVLVCSMLAVLLPPFFAVSLTEVSNPRYFYAALMPLSALCAIALAGFSDKRVALTIFGIAAGAFLFISLSVAPKYAKEEQFYRAILEETPHQLDAEYSLGNTYYRGGRYNQAIAMYLEVLRHKRTHLSAMNNMANALMAMGKAKPAVEILTKVVTMAPNNDRYKRNLELAKSQLK